MKEVRTEHAPEAIGPYSQGLVLEAGPLVFTAGQIGIDPATGELVQEGFEAECRRAFENLRAILLTAGSDLRQVVKTTVYLVDLDDFAAMNDIYAGYFVAPFPARSCVQVSKLPKGAHFEIEAIARAGGARG